MPSKREKNNLKYLIKSNNYVGLLFFALVLASILYIIKRETSTFKELEPIVNTIVEVKNNYKEITTQTNEIKKLQEYLISGDTTTFKIYQNYYNYQNKVTIDNISPETKLYLAYKYLESNNEFTNYMKYITCEEASTIGIDTLLTQCGGTKYNNTYYMVNTFITKDLLKETIKKLFNENVITYTNFYTEEDNLCYYVNDTYLCISHQTIPNQAHHEKEFIKAYKYSSKIEIIEKYKYVKEGIYYKGFNSEEVGEGYYKSTFNKINGDYYWISTEYVEEF